MAERFRKPAASPAPVPAITAIREPRPVRTATALREAVPSNVTDGALPLPDESSADPANLQSHSTKSERLSMKKSTVAIAVVAAILLTAASADAAPIQPMHQETTDIVQVRG